VLAGVAAAAFVVGEGFVRETLRAAG
jgi:hypothetical protein